jgi:subfamily B ATP-binding cassette protein MsbA
VHAVSETSGRALARRGFAYLRPYVWPHFAVAVACMVLYSASSGVVPYLVRSLVDDVLANRDAASLELLPPLIVLVFGVRGLVSFGHTYLTEFVGQHIVYDLRNDLDDKVQYLPVSYFDRMSSGSILSHITTDVLLVRQALTEGGAVVIRDFTTVIVLLGVTFYLDFTLAIVTFVVFPAVVLPLQRLSRRMRKLSHQGLDSLGDLSALLQETLVGNRVVKAFGMQEYEKRRFSAESERLLRINMRAARIKSFTTPMTEVLAAVSVAAVLAYGGGSVLAGGRTAGSFLAFLSALVLLYEPFKKIVRANNLVQTGLGAARRIFEFLDEPSETAVESGGRSDVSFRETIRLEIRRGEVVALVGPSGGGKSTLADLLPRFYEIGEGRISIDGVDVRNMNMESLRAQIAVVTQFTFLFNDTVRANISYGRSEETAGAVEAAAEAANAREFIESLPQGYDTVVGELGVQLSGGQRQRIAIARALVKDAPILILDEATSALDTESEKAVQGAIDTVMRDRTVLVIAHRLSTIRGADRIAVVDEGRIVDSGTHDELIESCDLYRRLQGETAGVPGAEAGDGAKAGT